MLKRILYYHLVDTTFLIKDEEILKSRFRVHSVFFHRTTGWRFIRKNISATIRLLWLISRLDIFFTWFADYHALIPVILFKILGKRSYIVIGGYDAAKNADIGYGAHLSPFRSKVIRFICRHAYRIIPVSNFSQNELFHHTRTDMGYKSKVIFNGVDPVEFYFDKIKSRENVAVMIAGDKDDNVFRRKSADIFVEAAKALPQYQFLLIGLVNRDRTSFNHIANLEVLPWLDPKEIRVKLEKAKIICQWSRYEAFGVVLIEGMMCGCTPVCYAYGGTKEIIDDTIGYAFEDLSIDSVCEALQKAFRDPVDPQKIRDCAIARFSLERREKELIELIGGDDSRITSPPSRLSRDTSPQGRTSIESCKGESEFMLVSVIIPTYNSADFIRETLLSVKNQTYPHLEIICVDDGSEDDTAKIIEETAGAWKHFRFLRIDHAGAPAARNAGTRIAKGEYIQYLDSDDILLPDKIEHQVNLIVIHETRPAFIAAPFLANKYGREILKADFYAEDAWVALVRSQLGTTSSNLWQRGFIERIGFWRDISRLQDYYLMWDILRAGGEVMIDTERKCIKRLREKSIFTSKPILNRIHGLELRSEMLYTLREEGRLSPELEKELLDRCFVYVRNIYKVDPDMALKQYDEIFDPGFVPPKIFPGYSLWYGMLGFRKLEFILFQIRSLLNLKPRHRAG